MLWHSNQYVLLKEGAISKCTYLKCLYVCSTIKDVKSRIWIVNPVVLKQSKQCNNSYFLLLKEKEFNIKHTYIGKQFLLNS